MILPARSFAESTSPMCFLRSSLRVTSLACTVMLTAQVTIADAGPDQYLCDENAFLQGNAVATGEVGTWALVAGSLVFVNPNDPGSEVVNAAPGVHTLQWTITNGTDITTDQVQIWVYDGNAPLAYGGEDVVVQLPQTSVLLQAGPFSWPTTCMWTVLMGSGTISEPTQAITMYGGATVGINVLLWSCDNGPCGITTDEVVITVEEAMALSWTPARKGLTAAFDPNTERLSISATENIDRVLLTDQMGRVVLDRSMKVLSASLDVSQLSIGTYVVRAMSGDELFVERFAVVR